MLISTRLRRHFSIERGALDPPWPIFGAHTQASCHWILADVINFRRELLAALIVAQSVVEVTFLPRDAVLDGLIVFPIANHAAR